VVFDEHGAASYMQCMAKHPPQSIGQIAPFLLVEIRLLQGCFYELTFFKSFANNDKRESGVCLRANPTSSIFMRRSGTLWLLHAGGDRDWPDHSTLDLSS